MQAQLIATLVACSIAYFICGIPFGLLIVRMSASEDIRTMGSGNIGTTNVGRSVGKGAALLTFVLDTLKGALCTLVAQLVFGALFFEGSLAPLAPSGDFGWMMGWVYFACVAGHILSPYLHFKGGKGIACGLGAGLGYMPVFALGLLAMFILIVIPTRLVSLGSLAAAVGLSVVDIFILHALPQNIVPILLISALVIWAHRSNVHKLITHQERKFSFHKN